MLLNSIIPILLCGSGSLLLSLLKLSMYEDKLHKHQEKIDRYNTILDNLSNPNHIQTKLQALERKLNQHYIITLELKDKIRVQFPKDSQPVITYFDKPTVKTNTINKVTPSKINNGSIIYNAENRKFYCYFNRQWNRIEPIEEVTMIEKTI